MKRRAKAAWVLLFLVAICAGGMTGWWVGA